MFGTEAHGAWYAIAASWYAMPSQHILPRNTSCLTIGIFTLSLAVETPPTLPPPLPSCSSSRLQQGTAQWRGEGNTEREREGEEGGRREGDEREEGG